MLQMFSIQLAQKIGLKEAIIANVLAYEIMQSRQTGFPACSLYLNEYWFTEGVNQLNERLPYITNRTFFRKVETLVDTGILKTCKLPRKPVWYTFTDKGWQLLKEYKII